MLIFVFTEHYPATFKPYFDAQFARFIEDGHELRIFAHGKWNDVMNEKVVRHGLDARTRYFPTTVRTLGPYIPAAVMRAAIHPIRTARLAGVQERDRLHRQFATIVRHLTLPSESPDVCLLHGLSAAVHFPLLRRWFPRTVIALYYHGGELPLVKELEAARVRSAFESSDVVFTNTGFSASHAIDRGCPAHLIRVLPVGFDLEDYLPSPEREYRRDGVLRLLSAGRLSEEKGQGVALEAVHRLVESGHDRLEYRIVGDGYTRPTLEQFVDAHGLRPYVRFLGTLSTEALIREIGEADVVLLPSISLGNWVENQACVVQEAMLMKCLVVASDTGGVRESTAPELHRFSVPEGDAESMAGAIGVISELSLDEMQRLGGAGRRFAEAHYDIRRLNRELLRIAASPGQPST